MRSTRSGEPLPRPTWHLQGQFRPRMMADLVEPTATITVKWLATGPLAEAVKVLARATRAQSGPGSEHVNTLRSEAASVLSGRAGHPGYPTRRAWGLDVLELAPTPEQGRRLTRGAVRRR
jgi:hypothetical protein